MRDFDAVIVGASLAGSATAVHLAREGFRVALVERRPDAGAFKRVCGHFIQASAVPCLERLGVLDRLGDAPRGHGRIWTRYGWFGAPTGDGGSISVRREVLDPLVRRTAAETPGVELLLGHVLEGVEPGRVRLRGATTELTAELVIGADGRGSRTAKLAGLPTTTRPNARFGYWGYFEGPPLGTGASVHLWMLDDGDVGIATPTDGGQILYVAFPKLDRAPAFKRDIEGSLRAFVGALPDAPPIAASELAGPLVGKLDLTNEWRPAAAPGLALVGDAALAADPVGAVGCGWALQSAEWLAEALAAHSDQAAALRAYARRHRRELRGHSLMAAAAARARPMNPAQRLLFSAAVHDERTAERIAAFAARSIKPHELLSPRVLARAGAVHAARRLPGRALLERAA